MERKLHKKKHTIFNNKFFNLQLIFFIIILLLISNNNPKINITSNYLGFEKERTKKTISPIKFGEVSKTALKKIGKITPNENFNQIIIRDSIAFLRSINSLQIWDLSQKKHPQHIGSFQDPINYPFISISISNNNNHLGGIVAGVDQKTLILVNLTKPSQINKLGEYQTSSEYLQDIVFYNNYLYLITSDGYEVLNISNPQKPQFITTIPIGIRLIQGNFAYGINMSETKSSLVVMNLKEPITPKIIGKLETYLAFTRGMVITWKYLIMGSFYGVVDIFNISDPTQPTFLGDYLFPDWERGSSGIIQGVDVCGNNAFVFGRALSILDLSEPKNIKRIRRIRGSQNSWFDDIAITNGYLYALRDNELLIYTLFNNVVIWQYLGIGFIIGLVIASPIIVILSIKLKRKGKRNVKEQGDECKQ